MSSYPEKSSKEDYSDPPKIALAETNTAFDLAEQPVHFNDIDINGQGYFQGVLPVYGNGRLLGSLAALQPTDVARANTVQMIKSISENAGNVTTSAGNLSGISTQISENADRISGRSENVAASSTTLSTNIDAVAATTKEIANNVAQASSGISDINENLATSNTVASDISSEISIVN